MNKGEDTFFFKLNAFINLQTTLTIHEKTYLQYFALRYLLIEGDDTNE